MSKATKVPDIQQSGRIKLSIYLASLVGNWLVSFYPAKCAQSASNLQCCSAIVSTHRVGFWCWNKQEMKWFVIACLQKYVLIIRLFTDMRIPTRAAPRPPGQSAMYTSSVWNSRWVFFNNHLPFSSTFILFFYHFFTLLLRIRKCWFSIFRLFLESVPTKTNFPEREFL